MNFENINSNSEANNEATVEQERINSLWNKYHLTGKPVRFGTPVYKRLFDTCESYLNTVYNDRVSKIPGSDSLRRNLHNTIALMVDGRARSSMTEQRAAEIANFASMLVYKLPLSQMDDIYSASNHE